MNNKFILLVAIFFSCSNSETENKRDKMNEFKFQNDTLVLERRFDFPGKELSIVIPSDWIKEELEENTIVFRENYIDTIGFCTNLVVRTIPNKNSLNLNQIAEVFISALPERFDTMKIIEVSDEIIKDMHFKVVDFKVLEDGTHLASSTAYMLHNNNIITLYFTAENLPGGVFIEKRKLFFSMLNSMSAL